MSDRLRGGDETRPIDLSLVLIDGDNLLHRVRGSRDEAGIRWLLPQLRAWRPPEVRVVVMLDGHPDPGESVRRRVATGVEFHHSLNLDGDTALLGILAARPYADRGRTMLITDDRALADRARHAGGLVRRVDWLTAQLATATGSGTGRPPGMQPTRSGRPAGIGRGRPPRAWPRPPSADVDPDTGEAPDREPWRPGRGATKKRGNPKRGHPG